MPIQKEPDHSSPVRQQQLLYSALETSVGPHLLAILYLQRTKLLQGLKRIEEEMTS